MIERNENSSKGLESNSRTIPLKREKERIIILSAHVNPKKNIFLFPSKQNDRRSIYKSHKEVYETSERIN